jgi:DNA polymerase-3 subunit epsilon
MEAKTLIAQAEFVAFDLETTGLHPVSSQIVEIGAVRFRGDGEVLGQFQQLIDPKAPIPREASRVHGITASMVKGQPILADVLPSFLEFLSDSPALLLAHNASFDLGFLSVALSRFRQPVPAHQTLDTCALARRRISLPRHNLEALGRHWGLIAKEAHRALEDSLLLKQVFEQLVNRPPAVFSLEDLYQLSSPRPMDAFATALEHPLKGYEALWTAMAEGLPIEMVYAGGSRRGELRRITPQNVLRMRSAIYLSAYCHQDRCEKTFRLDRILSYKTLPGERTG